MNQIVPHLASEVLSGNREYSCHTVDQKQPWQYQLHHHVDYCDLIYVHRGEVRHEVNRREFLLSPGMTALVRHGDRHTLCGRDLLMYNLNFRVQSLTHAASYLGLTREADLMLKADEPPIFGLCGRPAPRDELQKLLVEQHRPGAAREFRVFLAGWLLGIAGEIAPDSAHAVPPWISALLNTVNERVEQPIRVGDMPALCGRTAEHIARSFRVHLGMTPSAAVNRARLQRAALLLAHTNRSVLDICYSLGYNSPSYFSRLFRLAHGEPPARYRQMNAVFFR